MTHSDSHMEELILQLRAIAPNADLTADSRKICPGDIFFAMKTHAGDGRDYIQQAIENGAAAIVREAGDGASLTSLQIPVIQIENLDKICGKIAASWYEMPDAELVVVAVTGTNGKTSTTQWIAKAMSLLKTECAVIGTLGNGIWSQGHLSEMRETGFTTPDAIQLQRSLNSLKQAGAKALAIEASSIGIHQGRLTGLDIQTAVFTNLTRDHLDYHGTMAAYADAKRSLFETPGLRLAVLNVDDKTGTEFAETIIKTHPDLAIIGYSVEGTADARFPLLRATHLKTGHAGTSFHLDSPFGHGLIRTQLVGRFNVSNVLAVMAVLLGNGHSFAKVVSIIEKLTPVPGRMQLLGSAGHAMVVIDYAHTPDALEKTIEALLPVAEERQGKLWCLFGCGGDRDPGKRPQMGRISQKADQIVVTSDNPRTEDPSLIIRDILSGMTIQPHVIEDRATAILYAIKHAQDKDVVLLAGKGHETYQDINGKKWPFSDEEHASLALATVATSMKRNT